MWANNLTFTDYFTSVSPGDSSSESEYSNDSDSDNLIQNESLSMSIISSYDRYCGNLQEIGSTYNKIHGIASIAVCIFGTVANILNFLILTRKEMVNSTNAILTGLAVSDLLNLIEYVPYAIYTDFLPDLVDGGQRKTYPWAVYVLIHSNFSQVCHTISIWLTVTIAAWRYFMISMPLQSRTLCSMRRAKLLICMAYCITPVLCAPIYFTFSVQTVSVNRTASMGTSDFTTISSLITPQSISSSEKVKYVVNLSNLSIRHPNLVKINFWIYSVVLKIIPCILLTVVSFCLINSLVKAKKRKEMLLGPLSSSGVAGAAASSSSSKSNKPPGCPSTPLTFPSSIPPPSSAAQITSSPALLPPPAPPIVFNESDSDICRIDGCLPTAATARLSREIPLHELSSLSLPPQALLGIRRPVNPEIDSDEQTSIYGGLSRYPSTSNRTGSSTSTGDMYLTSRTTRMLLTVLILFLITEFPQGILALFSAIVGQEFFKRCYIPMANLMDFLALLNCSINFILYCFMSKRFREAFMRMLERKRVV